MPQNRQPQGLGALVRILIDGMARESGMTSEEFMQQSFSLGKRQSEPHGPKNLQESLGGNEPGLLTRIAHTLLHPGPTEQEMPGITAVLRDDGVPMSFGIPKRPKKVKDPLFPDDQ